MKSMRIALGPLQYYWPQQQVFDFYSAAAHWPVTEVYLGETVCSRRKELRLEDWLEIARHLAAAGKVPLLSTQVLLESRVELRTLHRLTEQQDFMVEANDMGAVHCLQGRPFVGGPFLNIYNPPSLSLLARQGAVRWVMPLEMGRQGLTSLLQHRPAGLQTEVFAYGRMPLAFSARCFTARNRNYPKDNCHYVCLEYPDGLLLETREAEEFLTINGIQTQSSRVYNLIQELDELKSLGVEVIRLSPQAQYMEEIVQTFAAVLNAQQNAQDALLQMHDWLPAQSCNGFWHQRAGHELVTSATSSL